MAPRIPALVNKKTPKIPKPVKGAGDRIVEALDPLLHLMSFIKPELKDGIEFAKKVANGDWLTQLSQSGILSEDQADMLKKMPLGIPQWYSTLKPQVKEVVDQNVGFEVVPKGTMTGDASTDADINAIMERDKNMSNMFR